MPLNSHPTRRTFLQQMAGAGAAVMIPAPVAMPRTVLPVHSAIGVDAHCWVYASKFPPDWDATDALDNIFSDIKAAGYSRLELMESIVRHDHSVARLSALIRKYDLPVGGCSYYGDFWDKGRQTYLLEDLKRVIEHLQAVGATMIGLTVGDAERKKTDAELDTQAENLEQVRNFCVGSSVVPNLHNHIFEVKDDLYDLKGTLARIPDFKLGPDLNWLVRAGVDPVWFINTYGHQMVYMHLRDQKADGRWTEALGEGVIDFPAIAGALKKINYAGRAAVELALDDPPVRPLEEDWMISRRYVKKVFNW